MAYKVGDVIQFVRTFTKEDVTVFMNVSKDEGVHHQEVLMS